MLEPHGLLEQTATVGEALLTGLAVGIYYDIFRIIRRIIRCRYANIVSQDIFFWMTTAVFVFFVTIKLNGGMLRIIFVAMALAGWALYMATVGALLMAVVDALIRWGRAICARLHKILGAALEKYAKKGELKQKSKISE